MKINENQIIYKAIVGSKLYGTDNENSDTDIRGIYLPTKKQLLLNDFKDVVTLNVNNTKNTKDDIDEQYWSIQYFFKLLKKGDTNAIDLLHSKSYTEMVLHSTFLFDSIYAKRQMFYHKNMKAFIGYAKSQFEKFVVKGDRLNDLLMLKEWLSYKREFLKIQEIYNELPETKNLKKVNGFYIVINKKFQNTIIVSYLRDKVNNMISQYGERTKSLKDGNIDWKSLCHALRVLYELIEIYETNDLVFPLLYKIFLKDLKEGSYGIKYIQDVFETNMKYLEILIERCEYPEELDSNKIDDFLFELINGII